MLSRLAKLAAIAASVLALVVIVTFLYVRTLDLSRFRAPIETAVERSTGRELLIEGDFHAVISLLPTVAVESVTLANAAWSDRPAMARIGRLEVSASVSSLLRGEIDIVRVVVSDVDVLLEKDAEGRANWQFESDREKDEAREPLVVRLHRIEVDDVRLEYVDAVAGHTQRAGVRSLRVTRVPLTEHFALELDAEYAGEAVRVEGEVPLIAQVIDDLPVRVDLGITSGASDIEIDAVIERPRSGRDVTLDASFVTPDLASLGALAGRPLPRTEPIDAAAHVEIGERGVRVTDLVATVGNSDVEGEVSVAIGGDGARPRVSGRLVSRKLDVGELLGPPQPRRASPPRPDGRVFTSQPLPLEQLRAVDLDVEIEVANLDTASVDLGTLAAHVELVGGRLSVDPFTADLADGHLESIFELDASSDRPTLELRSSAERVQVGLLVAALTESHLAERGPSDVDVALRANGRSVRELMASLDGHVMVSVGEGRIRDGLLDLLGADLLMELVELINPLVKKSDYAEVECAVAYLELDDGIATSDKTVALETRKMNVTAAGTIDLRSERLAMAVRPKAEKGLNLGASGLAELVYVGGSLGKPAVSLDLKGVATQAANVTAAFATFGASLVAQSLLADKSPCQTALDEAGRRRGSKGSGASARAADAGGPGEGPAKAPEEKTVAKEVREFFGSLFGK